MSYLSQSQQAQWATVRSGQPGARPIGLRQAKSHLALPLTDNYHDERLLEQIDAATERVEMDIEQALIRQTYQMTGYAFPWPTGAIYLHRSPAVSVESVKYIDGDGNEQTLVADTDYEFDRARSSVVPGIGLDWPTDITSSHRAVTIDYTAGYGTDTSTIPADLISAMYLALDQMFFGIDNQETYDRVIARHKRSTYP
jgi:uncharacterized phiE125 gp8 family phage protein